MMRHGFGWRGFCAAEGVTAKDIVSSDWLGRIGRMSNGNNDAHDY